MSNAGICRLGDFLTQSDEDRDAHLDINVKGAWNTCKAVLPGMVERKWGKIVIMSSVTGDMVADPGEAAYAMSKAALVGLTKALAREFAPCVNVRKRVPWACRQAGTKGRPLCHPNRGAAFSRRKR